VSYHDELPLLIQPVRELSNQHKFTGYPGGEGAWLEIGPYNLCMKIVKEPVEGGDECQVMPTVMIEAFVTGFEEREPVSRLEIAYQPARFYQRLSACEDKLGEYARQSAEAIRIGSGVCKNTLVWGERDNRTWRQACREALTYDPKLWGFWDRQSAACNRHALAYIDLELSDSVPDNTPPSMMAYPDECDICESCIEEGA